MALSSRELYLILRAKNEATSALNSLSNDLRKASDSASLMGAQAQKAHLQAEQAAARNAKAQQEFALRTLESQKAVAQQAVSMEQSNQATLRYAGSMLDAQKASEQQRLSVLNQKQAVDQNVVSLLQNAKAQNDLQIATLRSVPGNDDQVRSIRASSAAMQQQIVDTRNSIIARQNDINASRDQINIIQEQINNSDRLAQTHRAALLNAQDEVRATEDSIRVQKDAIAQSRIDIANRQEQIDSVNREIANTKEANVTRADASAKLKDQGQVATSVGAGMVIAGGTALAGMFALTQSAVDYEKATAQTLTQVHGQSTSLTELGNIGLDVAKKFGVSFDSIQAGLFDIFSSTDATIPQATTLLNAFAKAAVAGSVDVKTAGDTTIGVMNAWKRPITDVNEILDTQFKIVQLGKINYEQLSGTIGRSIPSAVHAGQTFEQLGGMIAFLTRNNLTAAQSVTSAGRALDLFANPTVGSRLQAMGISARDASGNFRPLADVVVELQKKLGKLDPLTRAKEIDALFKGSGNNIQARRFWDLVLASDKGAKSFKDMTDQVTQSGGSLETAYKTMSDTMAVKNEKMKNDWQALKIELGTTLFPVLAELVGHLKDVIDWFEKLDPSTKKNIAMFAIIASVFLIVGGAITVIIGALAILAGAFAVSIGVIALIIGAVVAFAAVWIIAYEKVGWFHDAVNWWFSHLWEVVKWFFGGWKDVLSEATGQIKAFGEWFINGWGGVFSAAKNEIQAFWDWFVGKPGGEEHFPLDSFWSWFTSGWAGTLGQARAEIEGFFGWFTSGWAGTFGSARAEIAGFFGWFTSGWTGTLGSARSELSGFWSWFTSGWSGTLSSARSEISAALSGIGSAFSAAWSGIRTALSAFFSWFTSGWSSTLSSARSEISSMLSAIGSAFSAAWNAIRSALSAFFSWFVGGWSSTLSSARSAVSSGASAIASAFSSLVSNVRSILQGLISSAYGIGSNIVSGIANGVIAGASYLASAAASVVTNALNAARAAVGIFSPSRDFADKVGAPISQGMAKGVLDNAGMLHGAVRAVTRGALRTASAGQLNAMAQSHARGQLAQIPTVGPTTNSSSLAPAGGYGNRSGSPIIVNVYTNEIDPRRHAMMLGSELQNQIG